MTDQAYLILENGDILTGKWFGAKKDIIGEVVFTTGMTGYVETLTDPSYFGQMIVQTFPLIGNYGIISEDFESNSIKASAYIVKDWCQEPSNFRSEESLDFFLKRQNIPGLYGIDTRALTKTIREYGTLRGVITDNKDFDWNSSLKQYIIKNPVASVSTKIKYEEKSEHGIYKVALIDFGLKDNIKRELISRGCDVTVFNHDVSAKEIIEFAPNGIMLSNGPGDPEDNVEVIEMLKEVIKANIPIFGICLGHQLLALAYGFHTMKLKYGHRGANQPVKNTATGKVFISSQNHGYAVDSATIDKEVANESYININDGTCEGIHYKDHPVFSVQFHPEACCGPKDTRFLFDQLISLMEEYKNAIK